MTMQISRRNALKLGLVGCLTMLDGCKADIKEGIVSEKVHHPSYSEPARIPTPYHMPLSSVINYPDRYTLRIENNIDGSKRTAYIDVPKIEFDKINIGDYYEQEKLSNGGKVKWQMMIQWEDF